MCGYQSGPQENWLITQFINTTRVRHDYIIMERRYIVKADCTAAVGCNGSVEPYILQTTNETNQSFVQDVSNFETSYIKHKLAIVETEGEEVVNITPIRLRQPTGGLYIALKDTGTCMTLTQLRVYATVCDALDLEFGANFSKTAYPNEASIGSCLSNMATDLNALNRTFQARCVDCPLHEGAKWIIIDANLQCMCLPGYNFTSGSTVNQCRGGLKPYVAINILNLFKHIVSKVT